MSLFIDIHFLEWKNAKEWRVKSGNEQFNSSTVIQKDLLRSAVPEGTVEDLMKNNQWDFMSLFQTEKEEGGK